MKKQLSIIAGATVLQGILLAGVIAADPPTSGEQSPLQPSQDQQLFILEQQVARLEEAIAPQSPLAAVKAWADGMKSRNGALQFAVLSNELRQKLKANFVTPTATWVTGASSPWFTGYQITRQIKHSSGWEFEVQYPMQTSSGSFGTYVQRLEVEQFPQKGYQAISPSDRSSGWYITRIESISPKPGFIDY